MRLKLCRGHDQVTVSGAVPEPVGMQLHSRFERLFGCLTGDGVCSVHVFGLDAVAINAPESVLVVCHAMAQPPVV